MGGGRGRTLSKKEAELRVRSLHVSESSGGRLRAAHTVPETETTATLMSSATDNAKPLSKRKYLQASYAREDKTLNASSIYEPFSLGWSRQSGGTIEV